MFNASGPKAFGLARRTLLDLWHFLKNPTLLETQSEWSRQVWATLAVLVVIDAALTIPITWFLLGYENFITSVLSRDAPAYVGMEDETFMEALLLAVVVAPLLEEPLFRGWLTGKGKHTLLGLIWVGWIAIASVLLVFDEGKSSDAFIGISLLTVIALSVIIQFTSRSAAPRSTLLVRLFPHLFWFSVVIFAAVHVTNYDYDNYLLVIPYVLPQLLAGILWGYARLAYGLKASIMLHAISNFWITCLYFAAEVGA
jgi:hypothetical protein